MFISNLQNYIADTKPKKEENLTPKRKQETYVFMIGSQVHPDDLITNFIDEIPGYQVTVWTDLSSYFSKDKKNYSYDEFIEPNYQFKPSIAIILLSEKSDKAVK